MRFRDFQISIRPGGLETDQVKRTNRQLFSFYEPVRLWLKEAEIDAPFRKLAVSFVSAEMASTLNGKVTNVGGVCAVTKAVDLSGLDDLEKDHGLAYQYVIEALGQIEMALEFPLTDLIDFVVRQSRKTFPIVHFFKDLVRVDRNTKYRFTPWFSVSPRVTEVGLCIASAKDERNISILKEDEPIYLEDVFPLQKCEIRGRRYVILGKDKSELFSVGVDDLFLSAQ